MTAAQPEIHDDAGSFHRFGPAAPDHPVIVAAPHAGRDYPPALLAMARGPKATLEALEDRHADQLVTGAIALGATVFVARRPRAWIDLNRDEAEMDAGMVEPPPPAGPLGDTARVRGGLGLIPRRGSAGTDLWRRPLHPAELAARIVRDHRPWHAAIDAAMRAARARFGVAILLDCHSMPPLLRGRGGGGGDGVARIVIGDAHGRSADPAYRAALTEAVDSARLRQAVNIPYAGGYALARHGAPLEGRHALQIEIDRSLYLEPGLWRPGRGLESTTALVTAMVGALAGVALPALRVAAE